MEPRDTAPKGAQPPQEEPNSGATDAAAAAAGLPAAPVHGREFFALPERTRADGGPVFDAIELAPVAQIDSDGTCEAFESLKDVPEDLQGAVFWSFYGHTPGEGVQCLGDFTTRDHAIEALRRLLGDLRPLT